MILVGGASVIYHMLNEQSRSYFTRAYSANGSPFGYFSLSESNHMNRMQECSNINEPLRLIEYLRATDSKTLIQCHFDSGKTMKPEWAPTIEKPDTPGAFISQMPEDTYNSSQAPIMDALFSFTSQVFYMS